MFVIAVVALLQGLTAQRVSAQFVDSGASDRRTFEEKEQIGIYMYVAAHHGGIHLASREIHGPHVHFE